MPQGGEHVDLAELAEEATLLAGADDPAALAKEREAAWSALERSTSPDDRQHVRAIRDTVLALAIDKARVSERLSRATHARETLLAAIAHDLRNPLNTFAMSTGLLRDDVESDAFDPTRAAQLLQRVERAIARMQRLIEDLVDASRIEARKVELVRHDVRAADLVRDAIAAGTASATERNATLASGDTDDARVNVDRARLLQALANVFVFALRIVGEGATVRLSSHRHEKDVHFTTRATAANKAPISAPQEGRGGLSLVLARGLVELHGGTVRQEHDGGLIVVVTLPASD